jgi:hypothetical protein
MKYITHTLFQLFFAFSLIIALMAWLAPVAAAHTLVSNNGPSGKYFLMHVADVGNESQSEYRVTIAPETSANITQTWSVSNSFGATIGINNEVVSAGLSYDVTRSTDVSETCSTNVNMTSQDQTLEWQSIFINYNYDIYWHSTITGQDTYEGAGWAKEYINPKCTLY